MHMTDSADTTIADAMRRYLEARIRARPASRAFFRISGFSEGVYVALLDDLTEQGWQIADKHLEVRSIAAIAGHSERTLDTSRSATWYRNNLAEEHALLLIQNRRSSDAQSLKDLYPVTEMSLSQEGIDQLIDACIAGYQLNPRERKQLIDFVRRLARVVYEPQLRDLAEFLAAVDTTLCSRPGTTVAEAIAHALPHFGLFRCHELAAQLNSARGDKLIRQLRAAARLGDEVLDDRVRGDYLRRLEGATLDDDVALGGLSVERKRELIRRFIDGQLRDNRTELHQVLEIDWREIQKVITAKSRVTRQERLTGVADKLEELVAQGNVDSEEAREVLGDLRSGNEPDGDTLDQLLAESGDSLTKTLRHELQRLVKPRSRKHSDFLVGLAALAVELLQPHQSELETGTQLRVSAMLSAVGQSKHLPEALVAFRALYGGIEQALPDVSWQIAPLWEQLDTRARTSAEDDEEAERERMIRVEIPFRVVVAGSDGAELARAELIWQYRSDSPATATAQTLAAEEALLANNDFGPRFGGSTMALRVPVYNSCPRTDEIGDLDLRRPIQSLGTWFEKPSDLRILLGDQLQGRSRPQSWAALDQVLTRLEQAWGVFVAASSAGGLLAADIGQLLGAYEELLRTAVSQFQTGQEITSGYKVLSQAWMIGPPSFESWAVVPLLHPLKLLWWRERTRYISGLIRQLLDPRMITSIVDEPRYRRELAVTYGSSSFPPVLALPPGEGRPAERFLPVEEADGYELFFREAERAEAFGLDTDLLAEDENEIAAQRAVEGIAAVVQDYIETYPFVRDGIEIVLFECRNGALPGLLVERLMLASARQGWKVRINIVVHTSDRGAPLFRRVSEWVQAERPQTERGGPEYFPPITIKVLECSYDELLRMREDTDIVILADVLADKGQAVRSEIDPDAGADVPLDGYLPTYRAQQEPFQQGDVYRRLLLSPQQQPTLSRLFLLVQHAAMGRRPVSAHETARFYRELTLDEWEQVIGNLHDRFNWVVCYDPTIDRFLMESAFPEKVQIIRYSLGLGSKRQHNLTVSSSHKAQGIVERRLAARLSQMLRQATPEFLIQVARRLVAEAKQISGDIVLRAAGPGAFLNELIGLVSAKFETERRYHASHPHALTTWILLDDFEHWFGGGKFPDLLFVAITRGVNGELQLHAEILEAKCVGQGSFDVEAHDAQEQVRRGVSRLGRAFASGATHLDALYWYDQLYRAVTGNIYMRIEQEELWSLFRDRLYQGAFELELSGHTWAFCYDSQAGVVSGPEVLAFEKPVADLPEVPLLAHHYGRNELCQSLRALIETREGRSATPEMWTPAPEPAAPVEQVADDKRDEAYADAIATDPAGSATESDASGDALIPMVPSVAASPANDQSSMASTSLGAAALALTAEDHERQWLVEKARDLERALRQRGIQLLPIDAAQADVGPSIVRFKLRLRPNESLRKIQGVAEDLARDLALASTPIIANVLRTNFVGVDIPREHAQMVELRPLLEGLGTPGPAELPIVIGVTPDGALVAKDLSEFPHLLVAGATNSGKSVFLRSMLLSLMTQYPAGKLELLIVDPKRTDFTFFNSVPYLRGGKVIIERDEARDTLLELVRVEMSRRQDLLADHKTTKVKLFNQRYPDEALPPIVALIDEYALLVSMMSKKERESFEQDLMILASAARSVSIHLVLATQRPSADIVTSTLKANLDARIAFRVASSTNSTVVLDATGAENLLGRGDMLFRQPSGEIVRLQAPFMDEEEMQTYLAALVAGGAALG
jgi:hypothetical protein